MNLSDCRGLRIGILGMGREGQSLARLLNEYAAPAELYRFDDAPTEAEQADPLGSAPNRALDLVFKSPGIPPSHGVIRALRGRGTVISSATNLFLAENARRPRPARTVVVTGTKGKSTAASLLHHVLREAGHEVALAGNIGMPLSDLLPDPPALVVAELSSYQLADFHGDPEMAPELAPEMAPELAVLLNLYQEHLDWHGDLATYHRDKLGWLERCPHTSVLANLEDPGLRDWPGRTAAWQDFAAGRWRVTEDGIRWEDGTLLLPTSRAPLRGRHNLFNVCAVLAAADHFGVAPADAVASLGEFRGLPHRLQELGRRDGVLWVNDSISTTPQSALAALRSYPAAAYGRRILILGGLDRGLDWRGFAQAVRGEPDLTVLLMSALGSRLAGLLERDTPQESVDDLADAVARARGLARAGDVVLLSPGAPSYGAFRNFEERGLRFAELAGFEELATSNSGD